MTAASQPQELGQDWWYVRAYPGASSLMDRACQVVLPWLRDQAGQAGVPAGWFFVRYLDITGQHLRLRVQATPDVVDALHARVPALRDLLRGEVHRLRGVEPAPRLLPGADLGEMPGAPAVKPALYSPELAKYGGAAGVALAEPLFCAGSRWALEQDVARLAPRFDRAALAVALMAEVAAAAFGDASARAAFWRAHQRQWGWQLRMLVPTQEHLEVVLAEVTTGVRASVVLDRQRAAAVRTLSAGLVAALDAAGAATVGVPRAALLVEYLHMEMNRWGLMPAEECLLGLVARTAPWSAAAPQPPLTPATSSQEATR